MWRGSTRNNDTSSAGRSIVYDGDSDTAKVTLPRLYGKPAFDTVVNIMEPG